jgi:DNA polymerase-3 subunit delta
MYNLFHGPDEFTMREELARLRTDAIFGLNVDVFSGADAELASILAVCDTYPFLSERRLVIVDGLPKRKRAVTTGEQAEYDGPARAEEAAEVTAAKGKKGRAQGPDPKAFIEGLAAHVSRLPETTVLVVAVDELLEPTHALVKAAAGVGAVRGFVVPKGTQLEAWLIKRAQSLGARLDADAAEMLATFVGTDLRTLAGELEKLAVYVGEGGRIKVGDVHALVTGTQQARVFDLTDALARQDRPRALALLHELLEAGESPLGIVAITASQTRALLQVKALAEQGMRAGQIAQTAGLAPYVVEKSLPLARQFSAVQLESAHRRLLEIDAALKLSKQTPEMALDLFVVGFGRS